MTEHFLPNRVLIIYTLAARNAPGFGGEVLFFFVSFYAYCATQAARHSWKKTMKGTTIIAYAAAFLLAQACAHESAVASKLQAQQSTVVIYPASEISRRNLEVNGHPTHLGDNQHAPHISFEFDHPEGMGRVTIDAKRYDDIVSDRFVHVAYGDNGYKRHSTKEDVEHCYYFGRVRGYENDSSVTLSTCAENGIKGTLSWGGRKYAVGPAKGTRRMTAENALGAHKIIDMQTSEHHFKCKARPGPPEDTADAARRLHAALQRSLSTLESPIIELLLVSTYDEFNTACKANRRIGGNGNDCVGDKEKLSETQKRAIAIANGVNQMYQDSNTDIKVTLVAHVSFQTRSAERDADIYVPTSDAISKVLDKFTVWYKKNNNGDLSSDVGHIIDNADRSGGTTGLAWTGTMCRTDGYSSGVNEDKGLYQYTAETLAHEIGHNLNAKHDSDGNGCPKSGYIMAAVSTIKPFHNGYVSFSSCSKSYIDAYLDSGSASCLYDAPREPLGGAVCGDGIITRPEKSATMATAARLTAMEALRQLPAFSSLTKSARLDLAATSIQANFVQTRSSVGPWYHLATLMTFAPDRPIFAKTSQLRKVPLALMLAQESAFGESASLHLRSALVPVAPPSAPLRTMLIASETMSAERCIALTPMMRRRTAESMNARQASRAHSPPLTETNQAHGRTSMPNVFTTRTYEFLMVLRAGVQGMCATTAPASIVRRLSLRLQNSQRLHQSPQPHFQREIRRRRNQRKSQQVLRLNGPPESLRYFLQESLRMNQRKDLRGSPRRFLQGSLQMNRRPFLQENHQEHLRKGQPEIPRRFQQESLPKRPRSLRAPTSKQEDFAPTSRIGKRACGPKMHALMSCPPLFRRQSQRRSQRSLRAPACLKWPAGHREIEQSACGPKMHALMSCPLLFRRQSQRRSQRSLRAPACLKWPAGHREIEQSACGPKMHALMSCPLLFRRQSQRRSQRSLRAPACLKWPAGRRKIEQSACGQELLALIYRRRHFRLRSRPRPRRVFRAAMLLT